jgi:GTPase
MFKRRRNSFKGLIIVGSDKNLDELQHREFEAEIKILGNHSTLIKENYSPIINCRKIVQAATITKIYGKKILMGGDYTKVKFRFNFRPEFIEEGNIFLFREGKTKGIGKITKLL